MSRILRNEIKLVSTPYCTPVRQSQRLPHLATSTSQLRYISTRHERQAASNTSNTFNGVRLRRNRNIATFKQAPVDAADSAARRMDPPVSPLAIVFTDIVKSTAIWENDSAAMSEAMLIHDNLIRRLVTARDGYEVKQNGDGFMIAFQSAMSALDFCLDVQVQLQEQDWPAELLEIGSAKPVIKADADTNSHGQDKEVLLWKGLRLRMSAHFGEPVCQWNDVIKRMDYLGPAVNRAARFISACEGGQIVVSEDFLKELIRARRSTAGGDGPLFNDAQAQVTGNDELDLKEFRSGDAVATTKFVVQLLGERHFKGVPEDQRLYFIIPESLLGRLEYFPQHKYVQASKGNLISG